MIHSLIELENVTKTYGGGARCEALRGVSLRVEKGEFVAVVGASGSGKSTLMNILGLLDAPTAGVYRLDGADVGSMSEGELARVRGRRIGFIFQGFNLVDSLSALENVELPLLYQGLPRARRRELARSALERVGLGERAGHRPGQLSGGQQQRVAIARAVAASPSLILADEPTGNLDSQSGEQIVEILLGLHARGNTVVLITHDSALARLAQRRVRVRDGRIAADGA